jgi:hypothetical protein
MAAATVLPRSVLHVTHAYAVPCPFCFTECCSIMIPFLSVLPLVATCLKHRSNVLCVLLCSGAPKALPQRRHSYAVRRRDVQSWMGCSKRVHKVRRRRVDEPRII